MLDDLVFECLGCGACCNRILIPYNELTIGLALLPGEEDMFDPYPGAVKPYLGLRRMRGKGHNAEIVCYQMVQEPCPLHVMKRCTRYEDRPMACREYPFSNSPCSNSLERHCTWVKAHDIEYGTTSVRMTPGMHSAMLRVNSFFQSLHDRMQRERSTLIMFDVATDEWVVAK